MIRKQSNNTNWKVIGALFVLVFALPQVSLAAGKSSNQSSQNTKVNFCATIDQAASKMKKDMDDSVARFFTKEDDRQTALNEKLFKQDKERLSTRFAWDNSRDKAYALLSAQAETRSEKSAVQTFKKTVDAAVETRRKSVDLATTSFKNGVDLSAKQRKVAVEEGASEFQKLADVALVEAKADCAHGIVPATARSQYVKKIEVAQLQLETSLAKVKSNDALVELVRIRQAAIEDAAKSFKGSVSHAEEILRKSLPNI